MIIAIREPKLQLEVTERNISEYGSVRHFPRARAPVVGMLHGCLGFVKPKLPS